jgi:ActR/RegA family two-component response regulator
VPDPTSILLLGGSESETTRLRRALARHFLLVDVAQDVDEARALAQRCRYDILVPLRPFSTEELVASVKALDKRSRTDAGNEQGAAVAPIDEEADSGEGSRGTPPVCPEDWTLEQVKHHHMTRVLEASNGNKSAAARRLGVSRKTLERKLGGNNPD